MAAHEVLSFDNELEIKNQIELNNFEFKSSANLSNENLNLEFKARGTKKDAVFEVNDIFPSMELFNSKCKQLKMEDKFEITEAKKQEKC